MPSTVSKIPPVLIGQGIEADGPRDRTGVAGLIFGEKRLLTGDIFETA
jgi:hypothetical protein